MFCHDRYSLLFSERKNSTIVSTRVRKRWGRKREEREQVIACTMIEYAAAVAGEKMASICQWYGLSGNICQRCVRRSSLPDTSLPHASPYRLSHHPAACVLTIRRL